MRSSNNFENSFFHSRTLHGLLIIAIIAIIPFISSNPYFLRLAVLTFIYSILSMSLSLLLDFTGIISLGHAAFFGIGAYATGILSTKMGLSFWLIIPIGAMVTAIIAFLFGLLTFKFLKGLYFALASWALGEILCSIYMNVDFFGGTNGIRGIPEPAILGFKISSDLSFYYFAMIFSIFTLISIERLLLSRIGRAWVAIREDQTVAGVMGINILLFQVMSFSIAAFYAGIAGSLYAYYEIFISPKIFTVWESIALLCMVLVGGRKSLLGSVVGAAIFTFLPEVLREVGQYRMIVYGVILLVTILFRPKGLIPPYHFLSARE
jgi:branched-chain amino acid transport system permease protein